MGSDHPIEVQVIVANGSQDRAETLMGQITKKQDPLLAIIR